MIGRRPRCRLYQGDMVKHIPNCTLLALLFISLPTCHGGSSTKPAGGRCTSTSECESGLTCELERCRQECESDSDCADGICVAAPDSDGTWVCTVAEESGCTDETCPRLLSCADDGFCRNTCGDTVSCAGDRECVSGVCVEESGQPDADADVDSDADADTEVDGDADLEADSDADADGDETTDSDLDTDADGDADGDSDDDADAEVESLRLEWTSTLECTEDARINDIFAGADGGVLVIGNYSGTIDLDPGPSVDEHEATGASDVFIISLNAEGGYDWGVAIHSTDEVGGAGIAEDWEGNIVVTGRYRGSVDFDPGPATVERSARDWDTYLLSLDSDGEFRFLRDFGNASYSMGNDISVDESNESIAICGSFQGTIDLDPGAGVVRHTASMLDTMIISFDIDGEFDWGVADTRSAFGDSCGGMSHDSAGNVAVGGYVSRDPDYSDFDMVFSSYSDGESAWVREYGAEVDGHDFILDIATTSANDILGTGTFLDEVDFDLDPFLEYRNCLASRPAFHAAPSTPTIRSHRAAGA